MTKDSGIDGHDPVPVALLPCLMTFAAIQPILVWGAQESL